MNRAGAEKRLAQLEKDALWDAVERSRLKQEISPRTTESGYADLGGLTVVALPEWKGARAWAFWTDHGNRCLTRDEALGLIERLAAPE